MIQMIQLLSNDKSLDIQANTSSGLVFLDTFQGSNYQTSGGVTGCPGNGSSTRYPGTNETPLGGNHWVGDSCEVFFEHYDPENKWLWIF